MNEDLDTGRIGGHYTGGRHRRPLGISALVVAVCVLSWALSGCQAVVGSSSAVVDSYADPISAGSTSAVAGGAAKTPASSPDPQPLAPGTERKLVVIGSGDLMIHPTIANDAEAWGSLSQPNFYPALADVAPRVKSGDLAVCHVETPFSQPGVKTSFPHYYVHPNLAKAIAKAGFRECSTASNWTADKGLAGAKRTVAALEKAGISQSGIRIPESQSPFTLQTVKGIKVAHLSYTDPNDSPAAAEAGWAVNISRGKEIAKQARIARSKGAEIVIVSLAMGPMGADATTGSQKAEVKKITANGDVNLVIGHGSHTVQPAEKINGTWVIWHGNLVSSFLPDQKNMHMGLISKVAFKETSKGVFEANAATGYPVFSRPVSSVAIDLASKACSPAEYSWYTAQLEQVEKSARAEGFKLRKPCDK